MSLTDECHEIAQFKEDKVDVGDVGAAKEWLIGQKFDDWFHFLEQVHRDSHPISRCVTRHGRGSFEVGNNTGNHFNLGLLFGVLAEQLWPILVANVLHDGQSFGQTHLSVDVVWQVGEGETEGFFLVGPASAREFRSIPLRVDVFLIVDAEVDQLVANLGSEASDGPVTERGFRNFDHF